MDIRTKAVLTGTAKDTQYNSVITPIYPTSTFRFEKLGKHKGYDYTRSGNPTRAALEENIAALEGGLGASATATSRVSSASQVTQRPARAMTCIPGSITSAPRRG